MKKVIKFLLIISVLFATVGIVNADNELSYHKFSNPVFSLGNESLIYSFDSSYSLNNIEYKSPFYAESDNNLQLGYTITGEKYLGSNVNVGGSCIPLLFSEEENNAPFPICMKVNTTTPNGTVSPEVMIYYTTTIPEIDEYLNNPSYEGQILVHYIVINPQITNVAPIDFNLGKWPVRVNEEKITDVLNKPISNDTILVFGSNVSMILNKGNTNQVALALTAGSFNYTGSTQLVSSARSNPDFSYIFYEDQGNYFLKIQRTTQIKEGILSLNFRPVQIDYAIKIEDPIVENTLNFLDNFPERLRFKPNLEISISNNEIHQLNFAFVSNGNIKNKNIPLDQNGSYTFNEYVDAEGNSFLFPFDTYSANIVVNPPLLISAQEAIPTQSNSGFNANIEINYDQIRFTFIRSLESLIGFVCGLITCLIGLFIKQNKKIVMIILAIGGIISIISLFNVNGLNHLLSIGSILIIGAIIFVLYIRFLPHNKKEIVSRKNKKQ